MCAGVGAEFSAIPAPLTPGERQVPGPAELNRSRERFSVFLWLPTGLGAFRNGWKSKDETRSGCRRRSSPGGAGAQVSAVPASPAGPGCAPGARPPSAPEGTEGRAGTRPRRAPGSKGLVFPRENKTWVSGEKALQQPGSRCWHTEDAEQAKGTRAGRCTLRANSFPFEIPEFQSTNKYNTELHTAGQNRLLNKCSC